MKRKFNFLPYLMIAPLFLIMIIFIFYPLSITFIDSFKSINLLKPQELGFVGIDNYLDLFKDMEVLKAFKNSFLYYIFAVTFELLGGLLIALILKNKFKGRGIILAILVLPFALPPVVNGVIWKWIYHPNYGLLNDLLLKLGVIGTNQVWLGKTNLSLFLIALVHVWKMMPLSALILLAQLQTIPKELYEAASIDGCNKFNCFRYITLKELKPAILIALSQATIGAFQLFDEIFVLTGTDLDTRSILIETYLIAFRKLKFSLGMALSLIITIVSVLIIYFYKNTGKGCASK
ncbi:carbohydrate ABC transporter permease [Haloimpatiens sp. FM7315]|uniref:carbohydrate ABC transporter permease n=1 Tax=Haloimpatiens sp. FM7315 TaxID=3298609 RepID=UPI0035A34FF9